MPWRPGRSPLRLLELDPRGRNRPSECRTGLARGGGIDAVEVPRFANEHSAAEKPNETSDSNPQVTRKLDFKNSANPLIL